MPRNGSGIAIPPSGVNPVSPGTTISSNWANTTVNDTYAELTNSLPRDGQAPMSAPLKIVDGSSSAPGLTFNSETSTGLYRAGSGIAALTAGGAEAIRFNSGGRVLLGTNTDDGTNRLQVNGSEAVSGNLTVGGTSALNGGTTLGDASGDALTINSNTITAPKGLRVQSDFAGNALIVEGYNAVTSAPAIVSRKARGTTSSPAAVTTDDFLGGLFGAGWQSGGAFSANVAAIGLKAAQSFTSSTQGTYISLETTALGSATRAERFRIDPSGNLLAGTTIPSATDSVVLRYAAAGALGLYRDLNVNSSGAAATLISMGALDGTTQTAGAQIAGVLNNPATTGYLSIYTRSSGTLAERVRVNPAGEVGIGITAIANVPLMVHTGTGRNVAVLDQSSMATVTAVTDGGSSTGLRLVGNTLVLSGNGSSEHARVTTSGELLLGTTSSASGYLMNVNGNATIWRGGGLNAYLELAGNNNTPGTTSVVVGQDSANAAHLVNRANGALNLGTNKPTRLTVSASGAVTPATDGGQNFGAPANRWATTFTQAVSLGTNSTAIDSASTTLVIGSGSGWAAVDTWTGGTARIRVDSSGLSPAANNTYALGQTGTRWSTVNSVLGNFSGTLTANAVSATGAASALAAGSTVGGATIGYQGLPAASVTTGAFVSTDAGKCVYATAGVTVPNSTMAAGDVVTIINTTGSAITITASIATLRQAGRANAGNRTLAAYGICTVVFTSATSAFISGHLT